MLFNGCKGKKEPELFAERRKGPGQVVNNLPKNSFSSRNVAGLPGLIGIHQCPCFLKGDPFAVEQGYDKRLGEPMRA